MHQHIYVQRTFIDLKQYYLKNTPKQCWEVWMIKVWMALDVKSDIPEFSSQNLCGGRRELIPAVVLWSLHFWSSKERARSRVGREAGQSTESFSYMGLLCFLRSTAPHVRAGKGSQASFVSTAGDTFSHILDGQEQNLILSPRLVVPLCWAQSHSARWVTMSMRLPGLETSLRLLGVPRG